jgi:hypothetical protein
MLKIQTETIMQARIDRIEGRKVFTRATLVGPAGDVVTSAEGLFVILREEMDAKLRALDR